MSTSIISLDQTFNANIVDIRVFEPCSLSPPRQLGGVRSMVQNIEKHFLRKLKSTIKECMHRTD